MTAIDTLKATVRTKDTETILDCILFIGGGPVTIEERMTRAALLDVYAERKGQDAADELMDFIGL